MRTILGVVGVLCIFAGLILLVAFCLWQMGFILGWSR